MRYSYGRNYSIALHKDAEDDLDALYAVDEDGAADIEVFLDEAKHNQETLDNLTRDGYVQYGDDPFDVKAWSKAKSLKLNLWRIRLLWIQGSAKNYRVIYAFHPVEYRYYVLGIVNRSFNYDIDHDRSKKIIAAYESLDIPRY